ncbi:Protein of unknown function, partial [Gryllus bimaculatus]
MDKLKAHAEGKEGDDAQEENANRWLLLSKLELIKNQTQWTIDHKSGPVQSVIPYVDVFHDASAIDPVESAKDAALEVKLIESNVRKVLKVLEGANSDCAINYVMGSDFFMNSYEEASDNYSFLSTVRRHLE